MPGIRGTAPGWGWRGEDEERWEEGEIEVKRLMKGEENLGHVVQVEGGEACVAWCGIEGKGSGGLGGEEGGELPERSRS